MKIMMTGGLGLMGTRIRELWGDKFDVVILDKDADLSDPKQVKADLTDSEAVAAAMWEQRPDWVLHLAAFTDVEKAESDQELAKMVNVDATRNIVEAAEDQESRLLYFSTGFVYEGAQATYCEEDPTKPVNYYGMTKLEGEKIVQESGLKYCIIRPNFPYRTKWEKKSDTVRWMIEKLKNGEQINLVADQKISPTFIDDLSVVLEKIITENVTGVFNTAGPDCLSFYEIGLQVADEFGFNKDLIGSTTLGKFTEQSGKKALQPKESCLISSKIEKELKIKMTPFAEGLKKIKESYV